MTNGKNSTIFIAQGVIPADERIIKGRFFHFQPITGKPLDSKNEFGVEMAQDLADHLGFSPGSDGVIMGTTLDGQMNA